LSKPKGGSGTDARSDAERYKGMPQPQMRVFGQKSIRNEMIRLSPEFAVPMQQPRDNHDQRSRGYRAAPNGLVAHCLSGEEWNRRVEPDRLFENGARVGQAGNIVKGRRPAAEQVCELGAQPLFDRRRLR